MLTLVEERPIDERAPSLRRSDNVSERRPPTNPSLAPSSHRGEEQRQSFDRPPTIKVIPQTNSTGDGLSSQDISDRRPPTNSSAAPSSHRGGEGRQSFDRPPSIKGIPHPSIIAGQLPSQDANEASSDPYESLGDIDPADPGKWALHHHRTNLLQSYEDHFKQYFNKPKGTTLESSHNNGSETKQTAVSRKEGYLVVNFAELQRMRLRKLQIKLVHQAVMMHYSDDKESDGWEETLQQYSMCHALPQTASD
jgi:hypothetical protein